MPLHHPTQPKQRVLRALLISVALASPLWSQAEVVTTPAGVLTGAGSGTGDAIAADVWLRQNVRAGSTAGITSTYPRNGDGSALVTLGDSSGKADWVYAPTGGFGRLADLSALSYDWYRNASSTAPQHLHPVIRLMVDIDGNPATTTDIAYLIYEQVYNGGSTGTPVPTNNWVNVSVAPSTNLWVSQPGVGNEEVYNRPLSTYQSTAANNYTPTSGWTRINGNSLILGISMGIGSGWSGTFSGAVDNPSITVGQKSYTANFELTAAATPAAVPTLGEATLAALAALAALAGLIGVAGVIGNRRRNLPARH